MQVDKSQQSRAWVESVAGAQAHPQISREKPPTPCDEAVLVINMRREEWFLAEEKIEKCRKGEKCKSLPVSGDQLAYGSHLGSTQLVAQQWWLLIPSKVS